ncbi:hypothetical protein BH10BAC4_BH10BAC4_23920 [soil metagenome]
MINGKQMIYSNRLKSLNSIGLGDKKMLFPVNGRYSGVIRIGVRLE